MREIIIKKRFHCILGGLCLLLLAACGQGLNNNQNEEQGSGAGNDQQNEENQQDDNDQQNENEEQAQENKDRGESDVVEYEGLSYSVKLEEVNGRLQVSQTLKNTGEQSKTVEFSSGHQFDVVIHDEDGNELYDFAEGMVFTQAIITEELEEGEELVFTDEWGGMGEASFNSLEVATRLKIHQLDGESMSANPFDTVTVWENQ